MKPPFLQIPGVFSDARYAELRAERRETCQRVGHRSVRLATGTKCIRCLEETS